GLHGGAGEHAMLARRLCYEAHDRWWTRRIVAHDDPARDLALVEHAVVVAVGPGADHRTACRALSRARGDAGDDDSMTRRRGAARREAEYPDHPATPVHRTTPV